MFVESFRCVCHEAQVSSASASTGGVLTALRAGNTLASSVATAATASTMPLIPFEREHHFAVHAEHHVCAQPAEQCAK